MPSATRALRITAVVGILAGCSLLYAAASPPDAVTPDGGRYHGPLVEGRLHGEGRMEWENGDRYDGEFARGMMSGKGRLRWATGNVYEGEFSNGAMNGSGRLTTAEGVYVGGFRTGYYDGDGELTYADQRKYRGQFVRGEFHGRGRYEHPGGAVYEGDFVRNEFTGEGVFTTQDGARHEGRFHKWRPNGPGRYTDAHGNVYQGTFRDGELTGSGRLTVKGRVSYEGEFRHWRFHGRGVLRLPNGDVYEGQFSDGAYDGKGTLRYAKATADGETEARGVWRYGQLVDADRERRQKEDLETALYRQREILNAALASLAPRDASRINLYLLAVAGDGSQEVFRREVQFVQAQFDRDFGTSGRSLTLINSRNTTRTAPMATLTSIREALGAIAARMKKEEDILFLFLTSHGSSTHEFTLQHNHMELRDLGARELGRLLRESGIRWKVVVVSACYSGGFIDHVRDDRTLVITAARHDRRSFGCADENEFTYFGRAFFKDALPESKSFQEAFRKAEGLIRSREAQHDPAGKTREEDYSLPQMRDAAAVSRQLDRWWSQRAAPAASPSTVAARP